MATTTPLNINLQAQQNFVPMTPKAIEEAIKKAGQMILTKDEREMIEFAQKQPAVPSLTR